MICWVCARYEDGRVSGLFWTDCIEDALYDFLNYRNSGPFVFETLDPDFDKIIDVYIFKRIA